MNLRAFKKRQLRARGKLIRRYGYEPEDFTPSEGLGGESIGDSGELKNKHVERYGVGSNCESRWIRRLIRGTPLMWITSGYYEPETDCYLPTDILERHRFDEKTDWQALLDKELRVALEAQR